jgi:hypothetical protein
MAAERRADGVMADCWLVGAAQDGKAQLEHFPAKWLPVRVKKMRQNKNLEHPI